MSTSAARPASPAAGRRPRDRVRGLVVGTMLALLAAAAGSPARAGDREMAQFLLKGAKADLGKQQYDAAFTKLSRAEQEDPGLVETIYWIGQVHERRDETKAAIAAYRRFAAAVTAKAKTGLPTKEELGLVKKAQERIVALATGDSERKKLDDGFADSLLAFARTWVSKDPGTAGSALRALLKLRPNHAEAQKLLTQVGTAAGEGAAPESAAADPAAEAGPPAPPSGDAPTALAAVTAWKDLLRGDVFRFAAAEGWERRPDGIIATEQHDPVALTPANRMKTMDTYALEVECRVVEPFAERHSLGLAFAIEKTDALRLYSLSIEGGTAILERQDGGERSSPLHATFAEQGTDGWHRLAVVVRGLDIQVFADGKLVGEHRETTRASLIGQPAFFAHKCKGEFRSFRLGTPP